MAKIGVIGASGYEGRQMMLSLGDAELEAVGFDRRADGAVAVDLFDAKALLKAFRDHAVTDVVHFPDWGTVARSVSDPLDAYATTLRPLMAVLRATVEAGVERLVLSSTASVYGRPSQIPVRENAPLVPISPLGAAAVTAERMCTDVAAGHGMETVILRYFNAAGADSKGRSGESSAPKHLITAAIQVALGTRPGPLKIYGNDYQTPDGTAIRDYVHVADVAGALIKSIEHLRGGGESLVLNCGYGEGASVQDVLNSIARVTGKPLDAIVTDRRAGDPPQLIADSAALRSLLGWRPRYHDLDLIIRTALDWARSHGGQR